VLSRDDLDDRQPTLGDAAAAHPACTANSLENARWGGGGADRSRRADVMRAVGLGAALEVVALDRALEALALRSSGHLDPIAGRERLDGNRLADQELTDLVAKLREVSMRRGVGLLQVPELGLGQRLLLARPERKLHGLVAVAFERTDRGDRTRAGLEHGDALH